jgi:paraquat-inducible protein A
MSPNSRLSCRYCGQDHRIVGLQSGEKAHCVRCGTVLAQRSRLGPDTALVFSITGLVLALPAAFLTFVSAGKLGAVRISLLFTGVGSLWDGGMRSLAVLVFLCGWLIPFTLLCVLATAGCRSRLSIAIDPAGFLSRSSRVLEHWAIPEVQVLAVLVAFMKLGSVVNVTIGPGFWCYCAMAVSLLIAQHSCDLDTLAACTRATGTGSARPS